jgi:PST family polysaccharide transporter
MAMAVTVTRFLSTFKDAGLSMATVQRSEIDHDQLSTLFWINGVFGIVLMVATVISAPLVAWFYGDPRLTGIVMLLAVGFAASGFSTQHHALLRRQMRFSLLAEVEIASWLVGAGLAILMARGGFGFWSLAAKELGPIIAILVGVAIGCRWRPGKPRFGSGVRPMLRFGGHLAGVNMVGYFTRNFDKVLIGWRLGADSLGLYSMAYNLLYLPIQQINVPVTNVAIGVLSRLQNEPGNFAVIFARA